MEVLRNITNYQPETSTIQNIARIVTGGNLIFAGLSHLFFARQEFQAQVPPWVPLDPDLVVILSGFVEIILGSLLIVAPKYRAILGWVVAAFFIAIFPGNISQYVNGVDGFGLDTDEERFIRLFFQPVFVAISLWSTGAWQAYRNLNGNDKIELRDNANDN